MEVEEIVRKMLATRIIKPSISPFSSLTLLVKKKYGGWRFSVDYRALNKLTIVDTFPIPSIDKILDELGRVIIFS